MAVSTRRRGVVPMWCPWLALAALAAAVAGCSNGAPAADRARDAGVQGIEEDARPDATRDAASGAPDAAPEAGPEAAGADAWPGDMGFVIAAHPAPPQVLDHGGPVLAAPVLIAITYDGYDLRDAAEDVVATIGASGYWQAATAEYGVGPATAGPPVHLADPAPASIDDASIQAWLADRLDGTHPEYGAPSAGSAYAIFYPATTIVTNATLASCVSFGGYHGSVALPAGPDAGAHVAYAVIPECDDPEGHQYGMETAASHELVEMATDPFATTVSPGPAWADVDDDHLVWQILLGGGEVTDLCQLLSESRLEPLPYAHGVERSWSNAAARAGHDPCVPPPSSRIYFAAAGVLPDVVTLLEAGVRRATRGVRIPLGQSRTIEVDLYSDGPADPWTVSATDLSPRFGGASGSLAFSWDATTGSNGTRLHLTVTALQATPLGGQPFMIASTNGARHEWFGYVAQD